MIAVYYALMYLLIGFMIASTIAKFSNWLDEEKTDNFMNIMVAWGFLVFILPMIYILKRFGLSVKKWVDYLQRMD